MKIIRCNFTRTVILLIVLSSFITVASCNDLKSSNNSEDPTDKQFKLEMYVGSYGTDNSDVSNFADSNTVNSDNALIKDLSEFKNAFTSTASQNKQTNSEAPKSKTVTFNNKSVVLNYSHSYNDNIAKASNKELAMCGKYDRYTIKTETDSIIASYRQNSNLLLYYLDMKNSNVAGETTENDAITIANKAFVDLYGSDIFGKFTFEQILPAGNQTTNGYYVQYIKYLHGYKTEEEVSFQINLKGQLVGVNASKLNTFDFVGTDITKSEIDSANTAVRSMLKTNSTIVNSYLTADEEGKCYIYLLVEPEGESLDKAQEIYVKVN